MIGCDGINVQINKCWSGKTLDSCDVRDGKAEKQNRSEFFIISISTEECMNHLSRLLEWRYRGPARQLPPECFDFLHCVSQTVKRGNFAGHKHIQEKKC